MQRNHIKRLAREKNLHLVGPGDLALRRQRCGRGFRFSDGNGKSVRDDATIARLKSLAVPPAYRNVRYAAAPRGAPCGPMTW